MAGQNEVVENTAVWGRPQRLKKMLLCCTNTKRKAVLKATCDDTCCCHGKQSLVIAYDEKSSDSDSTDISIDSDKVKVS